MSGSTKLPDSAVRAAQYVRMSTEHQRYSIDNQITAIGAYAANRGLEIVKTYADRGKSGLTIEHRPALTQLLRDVLSGQQNYSSVLIYDVSRWGRFQDIDESAHYEFLLRQAGVAVEYCAEPFENDGSPMAAIFKSLKRVMAGEYSRELSTKVFAGQCRVARLGFRPGGPPGYGLRRLLVDKDGQPKGLLTPGERKSIATDRVVLVPGPPAEIRIVRKIFELYVEQGWSALAIVRYLNRRGVSSRIGPEWGKTSVYNLLQNEAYIGNNLYNRTTKKLRARTTRNPPEVWVRAVGAGPSIIAPAQFDRAQVLMAPRRKGRNRELMLEDLRAILEKEGRLSTLLLRDHRSRYGYWRYLQEFGSILEAYRAIGYSPGVDYGYIDCTKPIRHIRRDILRQIGDRLAAEGVSVSTLRRGKLAIDGAGSIDVVMVRCIPTRAAGRPRWWVSAHPRPTTITVAARLNEASTDVIDFYVVPSRLLHRQRRSLPGDGSSPLDRFRCDSLDGLFTPQIRKALALRDR